MSIVEDIDTGLAGNITDTQSYSWVLLDWIFSELSAEPFFANFKIMRITSDLPTEAWSQVPFLGVYTIDEPLTPDGDYNMGNVRFTHDFTIGIQIILANNDGPKLQKDLDTAKWFVLKTLLRKDELTNRFDTDIPGAVAFNGFPRGRIQPARYGMSGAKNETPVGEQRLMLCFRFVTHWDPYGFPDLNRIDVTTGFPGPGSTPEERAAIEQVKMVYLFDTEGAVPTPLPPDTPAPGPPPGSP